MRPALHIVFALGAALAAAGADAYCVRNAIGDRAVHVAVLGSRLPAPVKTFNETVAAGKEFCCNPKNADCNPDRARDDGSLPFDARIELPPPKPTEPPPPPIPCGIMDPRALGRVTAVAPVRGFLRFEANARFDARRNPAADNPPYLVRALTADNKVVATYTCPPRVQLSETPRS